MVGAAGRGEGLSQAASAVSLGEKSLMHRVGFKTRHCCRVTFSRLAAMVCNRLLPPEKYIEVELGHTATVTVTGGGERSTAEGSPSWEKTPFYSTLGLLLTPDPGRPSMLRRQPKPHGKSSRYVRVLNFAHSISATCQLQLSFRFMISTGLYT